MTRIKVYSANELFEAFEYPKNPKVVLQSDHEKTIAEKEARIKVLEKDVDYYYKQRNDFAAEIESINQKCEGKYQLWCKHSDENQILKKLNSQLEQQLKEAESIIMFDINSASDGAVMNHAAKLDKYRKEYLAKRKGE